jgi:hypothetical protein
VAGRAGGDRDSESESERLDRNLGELLEELRVAVPGVQVLFAFLLVAPFNARFAKLDVTQERLYLAALVLAGLATAFLMAPAAHHRLTFRLQDKPALVRSANRYAVAGLACMVTAIVVAIALVTSFVFATTTAVVATTAVALVFGWVWFGHPLRRRIARRDVIRNRENG